MPILRDFWRKSWNSPNFAMHKIKLNLQDKTKIEILKTKPKSCNNLICKNWKKNSRWIQKGKKTTPNHSAIISGQPWEFQPFQNSLSRIHLIISWETSPSILWSGGWLNFGEAWALPPTQLCCRHGQRHWHNPSWSRISTLGLAQSKCSHSDFGHSLIPPFHSLFKVVIPVGRTSGVLRLRQNGSDHSQRARPACYS